MSKFILVLILFIYSNKKNLVEYLFLSYQLLMQNLQK